MTNYPYKIVRDIRNFQNKGKVKQFMTTEQNFKGYSKFFKIFNLYFDEILSAKNILC